MDPERLAATVRATVNHLYHPSFSAQQQIGRQSSISTQGGILGAALAANWQWYLVVTTDRLGPALQLHDSKAD